MNAPETFQALRPPYPGEERRPLEPVGEVELTGELVDSKCFLGVMRPATGKVHRGCAVRCLSGGVPPGLLVADEQGGTLYLLAGAGEEPLDFDVQWAGRTVRARGRLEIADQVPVVRVARLELLHGRPLRPLEEP